MLQVTDPALMNLIALRDLVLPIARDMEKDGRLDFSLHRSDCGTYMCLGGIACTLDYFKSRGLKLFSPARHLGGVPCFDGELGTLALADFFKLSISTVMAIFGGTGCGNLAAREAVIDLLIEHRTAALG